MEQHPDSQGEILLYDNGGQKEFVSVVFKDETFWLSQSGMAELFDCSADNISLHLKNIYDEEELTPEATTEKISVVRQESFVLNDELMKNGPFFGRDHFNELLERIREIRASERRAYQKIADVFEQCSYDYDKSSDTAKAFYAFVQNKLHFAVTGERRRQS